VEREVTLDELQAHLSDYVKAAQDGEEIVITSGDTRLARLTSDRQSAKWPPYIIKAEHPIHSLDELVGVTIPGVTAEDVDRALAETRADRADQWFDSDTSTSTVR
jgi:prevent-host-death family protein